MKKKTIFIAILWAISCQVLTAKMKTERNICYTADSETDSYRRERCKLDVYTPEGAANQQVLIWFHGGDLRDSDGSHLPDAFQDRGIVVVTPDCRLSPRATHPAYIEDAAEAVSWVCNNISRYGGDPLRISIAGHAEGAYLALMLCLDKAYLGKHGIDADKVENFYAVSGEVITPRAFRQETNHPSPYIDSCAAINHSRKLATRLFLFTGDRRYELPSLTEQNIYLKDALERDGNSTVPLYELEGFDHYTCVQPASLLIVSNMTGEDPGKVFKETIFAHTDDVKDRYETILDIPYVASNESAYRRTQCRLDIHYPKERGNNKVLVWFHGGGLKSGIKEIPESMMYGNFVVVSAEYRFTPKVNAPSYIEDAAEAVAWVHKHIAEYNGNPDSIYISGASAGGYLVMMLAMDQHYLADARYDADKLAGYVSLTGQMSRHTGINDEFNIEHFRVVADKYSPIGMARNCVPPVWLITGQREVDRPTRYAQNLYMYSLLKSLGKTNVEQYAISGFGHGGAGYEGSMIMRRILGYERA